MACLEFLRRGVEMLVVFLEVSGFWVCWPFLCDWFWFGCHDVEGCVAAVDGLKGSYFDTVAVF